MSVCLKVICCDFPYFLSQIYCYVMDAQISENEVSTCESKVGVQTAINPLILGSV